MLATQTAASGEEGRKRRACPTPPPDGGKKQVIQQSAAKSSGHFGELSKLLQNQTKTEQPEHEEANCPKQQRQLHEDKEPLHAAERK